MLGDVAFNVALNLLASAIWAWLCRTNKQQVEVTLQHSEGDTRLHGTAVRPSGPQSDNGPYRHRGMSAFPRHPNFCSPKYGSFHLPSLFAFVHPLSGIAEVDGVLRRGFTPESAAEEIAQLPDDHARLLVQHTTALMHERRHLHDTLVTPVGRALFRSAFGGAVSAIALLRQCHREGDEVLLPLKRPDGEEEQGLFDAVQIFAREYRSSSTRRNTRSNSRQRWRRSVSA